MLSLFAARHGRVKTDQGPDRELRAARDIVRKPRSASRMAEELEDEDDTIRLLRLLELADLIRDGHAGEDRGGEALAAIDEAIDELMAKSGDRILADINTFDTTASLPPEQALPFRQAYVDLVQGAESLSAMLNCVLSAMKEQPGKLFNEVLGRFREALGLDAAAVRPSTDPVRLKALMSDLWHLTMIETLLEQAAELGATLHKQHGKPSLDANSLVADLVGLSSMRHADAQSVDRLAERHGLSSPPAVKVGFLSGVAGIVAALPPQVSASKDSRDALIAASREALDLAIRDEEDAAWLGQGQGG
jgi:type III secretion protein W